MADLTSQELATVRDMLQDKVDETATPKIYLSRYNKATRTQFVSDATLQAINAAILADQAEELAQVSDAKYIERLRAGDDDTTAAAAGADAENQARYHLIRAEVRTRMLSDDAYMATLSSATAASVAKAWRDEIVRDRNYSRTRRGAFASVPFWRR